MRGGGCFAEVTTLFRKNSFHFPVHLFSERSQMTSKCDKKKKWLMKHNRISLMLLCFDVFCDLLLNRAMATWNLFILYDRKARCC